MPATGLFHLPPSPTSPFPLSTLLSALTATYDPTPLPPWTLTHRLFRDQKASTTADPAGPPTSKEQAPRYLQILSLSHHPAVSYVAVTRQRGAPGGNGDGDGDGSGKDSTNPTPTPTSSTAILALPTGPPTDDLLQLLSTKFGPLWTQRQTVAVRTGLGFRVGGFVVRVGEVVQAGAAGGIGARGVVVEVSFGGEDGGGLGGEEGEVGTEEEGSGQGEEERDGLGLIQAFWDSLGVKGARECVGVPGMGEGFGVVRQWCEVLRIRS